MGEDRGWVRLYRKTKESEVFINPELWQLFSFMLMEATHTECWVSVKTGNGSTQVKLLPGQMVFGRKEWSARLRQKSSSTWKRVLRLKNMGNCNIQSGSHYSVITICNWSHYQNTRKPKEQADGKAGDRQVTSRWQAGDTQQECKECKEGKEVQTAPPTPQEIFTETDKIPTSKVETVWECLVRCQPTQVGLGADLWRRPVDVLKKRFTDDEIKAAIEKLPHDAAKHWELGDLLTGAGKKVEDKPGSRFSIFSAEADAIVKGARK